MKNSLKIVVVILLVSKSAIVNAQKHKDHGIKDEPITGVWGLTNYFDTIVKNRELAKYRSQAPTWFAILLDIDEDSIQAFGSLVEFKQVKCLKEDIFAEFDTYSGKWELAKKDNALVLRQSEADTNVDTTTYIYRRRDDLKFMILKESKRHVISQGVTEYFNIELFSGSYKSNEGQEINFYQDGSLNGLDGYNHYKVRNYFGTLHPHKNKDVVTFFNGESQDFKDYNWTFNGDTLILREFLIEQILFEGEKVFSDNYVLGPQTVMLIPVEKKKIDFDNNDDSLSQPKNVFGSTTIYRAFLDDVLLVETIKLFPDGTFIWKSEYDLSWEVKGDYFIYNDSLKLNYADHMDTYIITSEGLVKLDANGIAVTSVKDKSFKTKWSWIKGYKHSYIIMKKND